MQRFELEKMSDATHSLVTHPSRALVLTRAMNDETGPVTATASLRDQAPSSNPANAPGPSCAELADESDTELNTASSQETPAEDPYQTDPDHYEPWLPRKDSTGLLSKIHGPAVVLVFFSTLAAAGLEFFLVVTHIYVKVRQFAIPVKLMILYFIQVFNITRGIANWMPVLLIYNISGRIPEDQKVRRWLAFTVGCLLFGLLLWVNYILPMKGIIFYVWGVINLPQSFRGCDIRVATHQKELFTPGTLELSESVRHGSFFGDIFFDPGVYHAQFDRIHMILDTTLNWSEHLNVSLFEDIRRNQTICGQGFMGNSDYYGIGIRSGLYLQWAASLLANNLLLSS